MDESGELQSPPENQESEIPDIEKNPVGDVMLGDVNPVGLEADDFARCPHLLFHGSSRPFIFSREFDYADQNYTSIDEGSSLTLGVGFYATGRDDARDYSEVRARYASGDTSPHVTEILPHNARCLDLRLATDTTQNAPVPKDFLDKWISFYTDSIQDPDRHANRESPILEEYMKEFDQEYLIWLQKIALRPDNTLKGMLWTNQYPGPPWMKTFRTFMTNLGYDGLIINEGSEKSKGRPVTAYVFYNLDKIGTYETWNKSPEKES